MLSRYACIRAIAGLAGLALLASSLFQASIHAQETTERVLLSPPFGLATDQSARLTLFVPDGTSVLARVMLFDSNGNRVAESAEALISGGAFHSFHFEPPDIDLAGEEGTGRRQLRASCWIRVDGPWSRMDDLSATLEIIRMSSGITDGTSNTIIVSERRPPFDGLSRNNDFLMGIVPGESIRLCVFNSEEPDSRDLPQRAIKVTIRVWDSNGTVIPVSRQLEILPGHFGQTSFDYSDLNTTAEPRTGRKQVRMKPFFEFQSSRETMILGSLEQVENDTGASRIYAGIHFWRDF